MREHLLAGLRSQVLYLYTDLPQTHFAAAKECFRLQD